MTTARLVKLQDAIVLALNAEDWGERFVAVRKYRPQYDLSKLTDLQVTVVPRATSQDAATRGLQKHEDEIDIAVQSRLPQGWETERTDELLGLVEKIAAAFIHERPSGAPDSVCTEIENAPIYAVEHLDQHRVFTGVLTLTFKTLTERR